ncbi:Sde2 N-terminal domain [Macleaya cordata]|uniref:Sde2 N-terminal domain n=1 Tax=Macleaya cordata TaxID=56857 RepID=A0A200PUR8_MACCD|nr:Sde2 N-terminal domain [Macleaya cordata]
MEIYNVLVKLLDGNTATLKFSSPVISGEVIKNHLYKITHIPPQHQRLVTGSKQIKDETLITVPENGGGFCTIHLLLRLLGGKGGFGSLLRGAATKAGQKKTNNFDACRDMSGRRLRHVNAEKKLEEWKAEEDGRKLEKIAEDFIKKKAKAVEKSGSGESEKYIEKYREDSAKCMDDIEASVRESFGLLEDSKRKILPTAGNASKRLKLWMVKETEDESDSSDEDEDEDDEKSVVLDDGSNAVKLKDGEGSSGSGAHSDGDDGSLAVKIKDGEGSSGSGSGAHSDGESSAGGSTESNLDEEPENVNLGGSEVGKGSGSVAVHDEPNLRSHEDVSGAEVVHAEGNGSVETKSGNHKQTVDESANISNLEAVKGSDNSAVVAEANDSVEEVAVASTNNCDLEKPLNFDDFNSAVEMEVLGMERLKVELHAHGLKCGGTLQERASRLFLLKTTPVDKLPKKLLAKK